MGVTKVAQLDNTTKLDKPPKPLTAKAAALGNTTSKSVNLYAKVALLGNTTT